MIERVLDAIDRSAIEELVVNKVPESKTLEYKQALPGFSDADKKEFLADITSFANASGGDIIYGIKAEVDESGKKTGLPESVLPIAEASADEVKLRLEEITRNGTDPRVKVHPAAVRGWGDEGQSFVLVVRIPRSFSSPHVVKYGGSFRFYSRNSAGKYPLDVAELRSAFLATDYHADRIRRFREDRLARIVADETPMPLTTRDRLVLHMVPLSALSDGVRLDMPTQTMAANDFRPLAAQGWNHRLNFEGLLTSRPGDEPTGAVYAYCQLFLNGAVEAVQSDLLVHHNAEESNAKTSFLPSRAYEQDLIHGVQRYMSGLKALGVLPPIALFVSLLGCRGAYLGLSHRRFAIGNGYPIDRDALVLPDVSAEDFDVDIPGLLKPVFDAVWKTCGFPGSLDYDDEGNWKSGQ